MRAAFLGSLAACNAAPVASEGVTYRDGLEPGAPNSGERGSVRISEVLWSGSVDGDRWDPTDVFVELRNESARPINMSGWRLLLEGVRNVTWVLPQSDREVLVGEHVYVAAKTSGCFPDPDWVIPEMGFAYGEAFELTLVDADERLMEPVGALDAPPFSGGYDTKMSRSMERAELMFGAEGTFPHVWHYYTDAEVDQPNQERMRESCRRNTGASPGWPNSPDYSGAFASGNFE
jgi:hypothetical protein